MAGLFESHGGEAVEKGMKGDYWEKNLGLYSQKTGKYWFTNERIILRSGFAVALDVSYSEIEAVSPCNVSPSVQFFSTGIKVKMKDGRSYKLLVLKRREFPSFTESRL